MQQKRDSKRLILAIFLILLGILLIYLTVTGSTAHYLSSNLNMS
ncbi:MAG: hypothetical protein VXZ40_04555 [Nanoarchaeota archaeon]|nr:hypothetical protein [Nanoarchaeota archaeon]